MKFFLKWLKRVTIGFAGVLALVFVILWISFYFGKKKIEAALPGDSQMIETALGSIECQIQGEGEKYILLLHGTPGSFRHFNTYPLTDNRYTVLSPSRPGYFRTPITVGKSLKEQAAVFNAMLEALNVDSVVVIGYSGGVSSGLQFALDFPEKTSHLILISGIAEKIEEKPKSFIQKALSTEMGTWLMISMMTSQLPDKEFAGEAEQFAKSTMLPFTQIEMGRQNDRSIFNNYPAFPFENVSVPTLIIHGTNDNIVPYNHAEIFTERIPGAQLLGLEGKDHFSVVFFEFDKSLNMAMDFVSQN